tara:strand:+ start:2869 stop:3090 length:222 start_codon:yes stop_codon:yes gene_type:complete
MGVIKQMQIEEMEADEEEHTDEYGGFIDNDEAEPDNFEERCEEAAIEQSIEDDWINADMERQDAEIRKEKNNE